MTKPTTPKPSKGQLWALHWLKDGNCIEGCIMLGGPFTAWEKVDGIRKNRGDVRSQIINRLRGYGWVRQVDTVHFELTETGEAITMHYPKR